MALVKTDRLSSCAEQLSQALTSNVPGRERDWTESVHSALSCVKQALAEHAVTSEAPDGPLATINRSAPPTLPTVSRQVAVLRKDHTEFLQQASALESELRGALEAFCGSASAPGIDPTLPRAPACNTVPDFGTIRESAEKLVTALRQHQEAESLLLLDTVNTDIGVGD
jgi:hypothetical protein